MKHDQLDLLTWTPPRGPAVILAFPLHRSHGATAGIARAIVDLRRPDRTGKLNKLRNSTRKQLEPLIGKDEADAAADRYIRTIRAHFSYLEKQEGASDGPTAA